VGEEGINLCSLRGKIRKRGKRKKGLEGEIGVIFLK